jgi:hypothetical protein
MSGKERTTGLIHNRLYSESMPFLLELDNTDRRPHSQRSPQIIRFKIERVWTWLGDEAAFWRSYLLW